MVEIMDNISVCMATYNGEKFIKKQIDSILYQLNTNDEIIIVDDCSVDKTLKIIKEYRENRIKIFKNSVNKGVNISFEKAIKLAKNSIIFMADQDDIWIKGRIELMVNKLIQSRKILVTTNYKIIDSNDKKIDIHVQKIKERYSTKHFHNTVEIFLGKANYFGCCMAFRSELKKIILPFPNYIQSHDLWIAQAANLMKSNLHIEDNTLLRRIHDNNFSTVKRDFLPKLWSRVIFAVSYFSQSWRILKLFLIKNIG